MPTATAIPSSSAPLRENQPTGLAAAVQRLRESLGAMRDKRAERSGP